MSNPNQNPRFNWQNKVLRDSIFPFRIKKLREFLLYYWEVETLSEMKKKSEADRKKILSEVAQSVTAQRQEWQEQFNTALDDLVANDKWFAMKTKEKYQLWYLQDRVKDTKSANWERIRRLYDLFEAKSKLPAAIDLEQVPQPKDLTLARLSVEEERLNKLSHDDLLKAILTRFDSDPDRYPQWLQYMVVHFSGMRYKSAHGSWADPTYLLELIGQNKNITIPDVPENGSIPFPADRSALEQLKLLKPKIPGWMWKKIVCYTPLLVEEVTENEQDWEVYASKRDAPGFDNAFWSRTLAAWYGKDITQWRAHHQATLDPVVTRSVCNEISEQILHLRWLTPSGGLNFKVDWYRHRAKQTEELPANHPRKVVFKRATSVADFQPGASIFWLTWHPQAPNSANVAYAIADFNFLPDGVSMNGGSKKKKPQGKGGRVDANGWRYGFEGNRYIRTRKLYAQEIQKQLDAQKRELQRQHTSEIIGTRNLLAAEQKKNKDPKKKSPELRRLENQLKQFEKGAQFNNQLQKEQNLLRRSLARQEIKNTLRWRHEAIVVSTEEMTSGPYVWTFETETEIGLNKRRLYDLLGTDNNDDYQVFVGYMPSLDNLPEDMDPEQFLRRTFMTREHAQNMKLRLSEMLRRDWILPMQYPEPTYAVPPTIKPITELPESHDLITDLPLSAQPRWVQIVPPSGNAFVVNAFYKKRNKKDIPIMVPVPMEKRQKLISGTLLGVSPSHKESPTDPGDGNIQADGRNFFYLISACEDYPDAVGTFIRVAFTADVADLAAFRKEQEKVKASKPSQPAETLVEATVDPDDDLKSMINCWEKKLAKTNGDLPAFKLPKDMTKRLQLQSGWKITVRDLITAKNGYFHQIDQCDDLPRAENLFVLAQDIAVPEEIEELDLPV